MNARVLLIPLALVAVIGMGLSRTNASRAADDVTQTRTTGTFNRIRLQGAFTTTITAGGSSTRVEVTAASDVIGRVTTTVTGGELVVGMKSGFPTLSTPRLAIAVPALRAFVNEGAGRATITGLADADTTIENDGAATIRAAGRTTDLHVALNGAGKIDTTHLDAHDVEVESNGVGMVHVRASGNLSMSVNGVGEIRYTGNPTHIDSHVNGVGRISRL